MPKAKVSRFKWVLAPFRILTKPMNFCADNEEFGNNNIEKSKRDAMSRRPSINPGILAKLMKSKGLQTALKRPIKVDRSHGPEQSDVFVCVREPDGPSLFSKRPSENSVFHWLFSPAIAITVVHSSTTTPSHSDILQIITHWPRIAIRTTSDLVSRLGNHSHDRSKIIDATS